MAKQESSMFNNLGIKVISLLLALLLELYFYSPDNSVTVVIPVTMEVRNLPPETVIVDPANSSKGIPAQIEVRGPGPIIEKVQASYTKVPIEAIQVSHSVFTSGIDVDALQLPSGVEVLSVTPGKVTLRTEPLVRKELLIIAQHDGKPAEGYRIDDLRVFPDTVVAQGPKSALENLQAIETKTVDIDGIDESKKVEISLSKSSKLVKLGVTLATVDIKISPILKERKFKQIVVQARAPEGYAATVEPSRVDVVLSGPANALEKISANQLQLFADGVNLAEGRHDVSIVASGLPKDVRIERSEPGSVVLMLVTTNG